jgi:hypothetical protein
MTQNLAETALDSKLWPNFANPLNLWPNIQPLFVNGQSKSRELANFPVANCHELPKQFE